MKLPLIPQPSVITRHQRHHLCLLFNLATSDLVNPVLILCSGSMPVRWRIGKGWFGFTATNNRAQTTAIKQECNQTEQNKKDHESSKRVRSFIPSWQI